MLQAAQDGDSGTVRKLLRHRVSPEAADFRGRSALSGAARGEAWLIQCL